MLPTSWSVISAFAVLLLGGAVVIALARRLGSSVAVGMSLYAWHTMFCVAYAWYIIEFGGDAEAYYSRGIAGGTSFKLGTAAVTVAAGLIAEATGASFLGVSLVFGTAGAVGLLLLFESLTWIAERRGGQARRMIWPMILMPSASFWSAGLGKDSISFLAASMLTWASLDMRHRRGAVIASVAIMFIVRPHIGSVMLIMLLLSAVASPQRRLGRRLLHIVLIGGVVVVLLPVATEYVGLGEAESVEDISAYIDQRQSFNQEGGAGIDISRMSLPLQAFTYLYRPLPYEAWSLVALIASIEHVFLLVLSLLAARSGIDRARSREGEGSTFRWLYLVGGSYILMTTTANLGIAVRQKWMLMPMLLVIMMSRLGQASRPTDAASGFGQDVIAEFESDRALAETV